MTMAVATPREAEAAGAAAPVPAALPFPIAAQLSSRQSFTIGPVTLAAGAPTPITPIQIPAAGYGCQIVLEVTVTGSAGTAPALLADAPFNIFQFLQLRTSGGSDLFVPMSGYQAYLCNKYASPLYAAPYSDPKLSRQYTTGVGNGASAHFTLHLPFVIDPLTAFGALPMLAANRGYQFGGAFAPITSYASGAPGVSVTVEATVEYYTEPVASTQSGVTQASEPPYLGSLGMWQLEAPGLTPGEKAVTHNNRGNVLRCLIYTVRNSAGARIDTNGMGPISTFIIDNDERFRWPLTQWEDLMARRWYGFTAATKDVAGGLDTGVYAIPFFALQGMAGDPNLPRSQYLATLDTSQIQLKSVWGSAASTLEIITNSVIPRSSTALYLKQNL